MVHLTVAGRVEQHPILSPICPSSYPTYEMVIVPSREFGNLLVTDWTETVLLFPEGDELPLSFQGMYHLDA